MYILRLVIILCFQIGNKVGRILLHPSTITTRPQPTRQQTEILLRVWLLVSSPRGNELGGNVIKYRFI